MNTLRWIPAMLAAIAVPWHAVADIGGTVVDDGTGLPVEGAGVRLQADPDAPGVVTGPDGSFLLPVSPAGVVVVAASVTYDAAATTNWGIAGATATDGVGDLEIRLPALAAAENPDYESELPNVSLCGSCHSDQVNQWAQSNHALAGTDAWVMDLYAGTGTPGGAAGYVFTDSHDPDDSGLCAACHTPMADVFDPGEVRFDEVVSPQALQGVSCIACHQMHALGTDPQGFNHLGSVEYRFPAETDLPTAVHVWGPLDDVVFQFMRASYAPFFADSALCASCHEYLAPSGAPGQQTYSEWLASSYAQPGPGFASCQDCHMPEADAAGPISSTGAVVRPPGQRHAHDFVGATEQTLPAAILMTADAVQQNRRLEVECAVTNDGAGHAFPSGVSVRNAFLVIEAALDGASLAQAAGPVVPFWADDDIPGRQDGDYAGRPGTGFAKVLEGRVNGQGPTVRPVLFIDAEGVWEDSVIPAGQTRVTRVHFELPDTFADDATVEVEARLLYRRAFRAIAVTKGWTETPQGGAIEIEVAREVLSVDLEPVQQAPAIPAGGLPGWLVLGVLVGAAGTWILARFRG